MCRGEGVATGHSLPRLPLRRGAVARAVDASGSPVTNQVVLPVRDVAS
jgi:hypothetical protein